MTFHDFKLKKQLLNALDDAGYETPTTIQQKVFSVAKSGRDIVGIAQTGTGKTLAYLLPALEQWSYSQDQHCQILIIVPTRELVSQVVGEVEKLTAYLSVQVVGAYGGTNIKTQIAAIAEGCDVVVATPGRLLDLLYKGVLKTKKLKKLVIDEVDEMLNLGFRTQLTNVLDLLPEKRQNLLFSATMIPEVEGLINTFFNSPERIEAAPSGAPLANIQQLGYEVPNFQTKVNLLQLLLEQDEAMNKVLVFTATKRLADLLAAELESQYESVMGVIHSNKSQNHRFNTVEQFHAGNYRLVIATDVVARGIDISDVSHVVNFDAPDVPENYMHRIGRTGRADKQGKAIAFFTPRDEENKIATEILMNMEIPMGELPETLEISEIEYEWERQKTFVANVQLKHHDIEKGGGAFHEKKQKNQKENRKLTRAQKMKLKYKKPQTRKPKNKRKKK